MTSAEDTSRISITAHHTSYTWYANNLSHKAFATLQGRLMYVSTLPWMRVGRALFGIADLETSLLQRHLIIDHLLEKAVREAGVRQILEPACGLSPRGIRFMEKYGGDGLVYVEADLPGMARRKRDMLRGAGLLRRNHQVVACNILSEDGEMSIGEVARRYLDPEVPTAFITEGIINYFDRPAMDAFWERIAELLHHFSGGIYLSDNMPHQPGHRGYPVLRIWNRILSLVARGRMHMHFYSDRETEDTFKAFSFNDVRVHRPESFYRSLRIPRSRLPGFLRVIEARV